MPTTLTVMVSRRAQTTLNTYNIEKESIFKSVEQAYPMLAKKGCDHEFFIADQTNRVGIVGKASVASPNMIVQVWMIVPAQMVHRGCYQWFPDLVAPSNKIKKLGRGN